jgi:hypothetical protein
MGVWRQATLASATVSFAQIGKIAFTWVAGDWAKQRKPEFEFALCPLLVVNEDPNTFADRVFHHRLPSRLVRNAASGIGSWQSVLMPTGTKSEAGLNVLKTSLRV